MYELVNATEMLKKAKAGHYAVGQFNINNLEWTKAILLTAWKYIFCSQGCFCIG